MKRDEIGEISLKLEGLGDQLRVVPTHMIDNECETMWLCVSHKKFKDIEKVYPIIEEE
jgi:hypothetical protein